MKDRTVQKIKRTPVAIAVLLALHSAQIVAAPGDPLGPKLEVRAVSFDPTLADPRRLSFPFGSLLPIVSSVAIDADGDFVIVWAERGLDTADRIGDSGDVYAQRYNADGSVEGSPFIVNTITAGSQTHPSIAMDADGDFAIAWRESGDIHAQRYNADGSVNNLEFKVNTSAVADGDKTHPSIAMDANGDFVIAWQSYNQDGDKFGIFAQRYNADGSVGGAEFQVNTFTNSSQEFPSIAMNAGGDFVIAWQSDNQDGDSKSIHAQRYNADGSVEGGEFLVNTRTSGPQVAPDVAMDVNGDFVVTWDDGYFDITGSVTNAGVGIYAQRYNADGSTEGVEFLVSAQGDNDREPNISMDANGNFVIAWHSERFLTTSGIFAQRYNVDGSAEGGEFLVDDSEITVIDNPPPISFPPSLPPQSFVDSLGVASPQVVLDADGGFVIAWAHSTTLTASTSRDESIHAQRYAGVAQTIDLNLVIQDDTADAPAHEGNNFTYSLITTNNGTGTALDVNLSESIPAGLNYVSDDSATAGWNCTQVSSILECNKAFMAAAEISILNVTVTADTVGTFDNTVTVNSAQIDTNIADNTDTEITDVNPADEHTGAGTTDTGTTDTGTADTGTAAGDSGGGSFDPFALFVLALPLWLRRRWTR